MNKSVAIIDVFLCGFLAMAFASSMQYLKTGDCLIDGVYTVSAIVLFVLLIGINCILRKGIINSYKVNLDTNPVVTDLISKFFDSRWSALKIGLVIFICWLPILIALYPGTFINDTWGQVQQFMAFTEGGSIHRHVMSDHHPFMDTLIIGSVIVPVAKITGAWHVAIFIYVLIQSFITSLVFGYSLQYVYKKLDIGRTFTIGLTLFYCIMPVYAASVQTVSKDALFSWIYVLFFVFFLEIVRTGGEALKDKNFISEFLVIIFFCIATKKVGFYVVLLSLMTAWGACKFSRRRLLHCILIALCIMVVVLPGTRKILGIGSGGIQEMLSIPFQQTARYVKMHPDDIHPDERTVIDKVLGFDDLATRYDPIMADPVKGYSQRGHKQDYLLYIKTWVAQGLRHPTTYVDAFNAMASGWFSFYEYNPLMNMDWHNQLDPEKIPAWVPVRNDFSKLTADIYQKSYDTMYAMPPLAIFLCYGFYAALIPSFLLGTVIRKRGKGRIKYWLPIIPVLGSLVLGCWLAPASVHFEGRRYLYPIVYTTPLIIAWALFIYRSEFKIRKSNEKEEI